METYLAIKPRHGPAADFPPETLLWGFGLVLMLTVAIILASKAKEWFRNRKHPQQEDEVWR